MAGALSVTPCPSVRTYMYVCLYVTPTTSVLSKLNSFNQYFMKLGHIVKYYNGFFKFDNGLYFTMPSGVIALCSSLGH